MTSGFVSTYSQPTNHLLPCCSGSMMLVGWGGNNGTTITAGILANKL
jgi:hypothetical protein